MTLRQPQCYHMTINLRVEGIKSGLFLLLLLMAEIPNNHLAFFKNLYKKSDDWMNLYCILQVQNLIMIELGLGFRFLLPLISRNPWSRIPPLSMKELNASANERQEMHFF